MTAKDQPPAQDPALAGLKRLSLRGGTFTLASQGVITVVQLTSTVVLARLLLPEDYGMVAMVTALTSFAGLFRDMGLSPAAVQSKTLSQDQQSNLFWLNVALGSLLCVLVSSASPLVAWFYDKPELLPVTIALSLPFLIHSLSTQHGVSLAREMKFGRKAIVTISASLVAFATATMLALAGYGYWALVWSQVVGALTSTLLLMALSSFHPGFYRKGSGIGRMVHFGAHVTGFELVNYFHRNLDSILIGYFRGDQELGLYNRAYGLLMLPLRAIRGPINQVAMPALSKLQDEGDTYRGYYRRMVMIVAFLTMPLSALLALEAELVIRVALGENWAGVTPLFQVLAICALIQPVAGLRGVVMLSLGHSSRYFYWGLINAAVTSISFLIGIYWGALGVAAMYAVSQYLLLYPSLLIAFHKTVLRLRDFFQPLTVPVLATLGATVTTYFLKTTLFTQWNLVSFAELGLNGFCFTIFYAFVFLLLPKGRSELRALLALSKELFQREN